VKLSSTGSHIWSKKFGTSGSDTAYSVDLDEEDNIILAGTYQQGAINFGGGALPAALSTQHLRDKLSTTAAMYGRRVLVAEHILMA